MVEEYTDPFDAIRDMAAIQVAFMRNVDEELTKLSVRLNDLEKAHNRLAHYVGHATEGNTIDRDMGAKNEM